MRDTAAERLRHILDTLGVGRGDTVFLTADMGRIPLPAIEMPMTRDGVSQYRAELCGFVLDMVRDRLGSEGTVLCPTFSYDYARNGTPYRHETSPSETGPLTEHLRTRPEAIRSLHPLNSVAGFGPNAGAVLSEVGKSGYGPLSPFARLAALGTKCLMLGTTAGRALVHAHHLEHMYGVNHMYHKLYNVPVYREDAEIPGPWLCFVRYLGAGVEPAIGKLEQRLREARLLVECGSPDRPMQAVSVRDVERIGYEMLAQDPMAFLESPVEIHIHAPGAHAQPNRARAVFFSNTGAHAPQ